VMDPFDRTIDAIIVTNPDQDHFAGFIPLLERYQVGIEFEPGTKKTTVTYRALESALEETHVPRTLAKRGMVLDLGGGAFLTVLYPDKDVSNLSPNDGSIVMQLSYASTTVMLMGDATAKVESHVLSLGGSESSDILKLGHHGSKTSTSEAWITAVAPKMAIVSAGCDNKYGHPSKETVERLAAHSVPYLWTCKEGTIEFVSNGQTWSRE
jgi:competence protein ComEC